MKARLGSSALGAMMIAAVAVVGCGTLDVVREKAAAPQPSATVAEATAPGLVTPVAAQGTTPAAAQRDPPARRAVRRQVDATGRRPDHVGQLS